MEVCRGPVSAGGGGDVGIGYRCRYPQISMRGVVMEKRGSQLPLAILVARMRQGLCEVVLRREMMALRCRRGIVYRANAESVARMVRSSVKGVPLSFQRGYRRSRYRRRQ